MRGVVVTAAAMLSGFVASADPLDWQVSFTNRIQFNSVVCSADGKTIVASVTYFSAFYVSTNSGLSWTSNSSPFGSWSSVAGSADAGKLLANSPGMVIWMSDDTAKTWKSKPVPATNWFSLASSASAQTIVIGVRGGGWLYASRDAGATWNTNVLPSLDEPSLASSADGRTLFAGANPGGIYVSTNSGVTWQMTSALADNWWQAIACSADGTKVIAGDASSLSDTTNQLYLSTNSGTTWTPVYVPGAPQDCIQVASSAEGDRLTALLDSPVVAFGPSAAMFLSTDTGATWTLTGSAVPYGWAALAIAADGSQIVAGANLVVELGGGGGVYISKSVRQPALRIDSTAAGSLLSWTIPSTDFRLQQSSDLETTNWADIQSRPTLIFSNLSYLASPPTNRNQSFFRLKRD